MLRSSMQEAYPAAAAAAAAAAAQDDLLQGGSLLFQGQALQRTPPYRGQMLSTFQLSASQSPAAFM